MSKKFVIATELLTQGQEREFGSFLSEVGTWWHWLPNLWLLHTRDNEINAYDIRARIIEMNKEIDILVFDIGDTKNYAARGPSDKREHFSVGLTNILQKQNRSYQTSR